MNAKSVIPKIKASLDLLTRRDQIKLSLTLLVQLILAILDLISIALLGIVASITLFGIQSRSLPNGIQEFINLFSLDDLTFQAQVAILGLVSGVFLVGKTIFSALVSQKILLFLNQKTAQILADLMHSGLRKPFDFFKTRNPSEFLHSLTRGVESLISGVIGSVGIILTEFILLTILTVGLLVFNPVITMFSIAFFGVFAAFQSRNFGNKAGKLQRKSTELMFTTEQRILESLYMYRELHVRNARVARLNDLIVARTKMARLNASVEFLPYVSKYSMEIMLVLGSILLISSQLLLSDAISALSTMAVFVVAATRVSPSILRMQQAVVKLRSSLSESESTLQLFNEIKKEEFDNRNVPDRKITTKMLTAIEVNNVSFKYMNSNLYRIEGASLKIQTGEMFAIVGRSGNGKSTLMDLMMGALLPSKGYVLIEGLDPYDFIRLNPGKIGYVAQESVFSSGTIQENLLLGLDKSEYDEKAVWNALEKVGLKDFVNSFEEKLNANLGERGLSISVGQRQRLSLARAIISNPRFLFLDEPTSALDSESEKLISNLIGNMKGRTTIIVIAHRLNTVQNADRIAVIIDGKISQISSINELKAVVDFIV